MSKKLRPCPWCGTTPSYVEKYVYDNKWTQYRVGCEQHDCDAQPTVDYHYLTEKEAIDAWNAQAVAVENESLKAENAKLRELCADMWVLLCVTGNDDLVMEVTHNGSPQRAIDADEISACLRELGIEVE